MTDNKTIKALELCLDDGVRCGECPYAEENRDYLKCAEYVFKDALDLIKRLKAEIEELEKYKHDYYVLKSEARKEFWEQIKAMYGLDENDIIVAVNIKEIDGILAEMEERK